MVLNAEGVFAVQTHVPTHAGQIAGFALFQNLAPDELLDVGVIDVKNDHFSGTTGFAAALNSTGAGVSTTHKAQRTAGRTS